MIALLALFFLLPIGSTFGANNQGGTTPGGSRSNKGIPMNPGEGAVNNATGNSKNKTGKAGKNSTKRPRIRKINLVSMPNMRWVKGKRPRFIEKKIRTLEVYGP